MIPPNKLITLNVLPVKNNHGLELIGKMEAIQ